MSSQPAIAARSGSLNEDTLKIARILILEDDVATLCLLTSVLQRFGFTNVHSLPNAKGLAAEFDRFAPDLVITDLCMPEIDGFAVIEFVRTHLPQREWLPVLVCTADDSAQSRRRAFAAGATDILIKPLDPSELLMRIRQAVRTRFLHQALGQQKTVLEEIVAARTSDLADALSELKRNEQTILERERFQAFGEMASGVVHDFNNSLMTVIGYSELLLSRPDSLKNPTQFLDFVGAINTAGHDASHIVSRLREFSREKEEGEVFESVDLAAIVKQVIKLTQPKWRALAEAASKHVEIKTELEPTPPVLGNPSDLREVITNLVFNAVDAMPKGGTITIRTRPAQSSVQLEVADTGVGMTPEVRQRCLEPFFTTKGDHGTGLGLSMVFGVIKRHEGTLNIRSAVGAGTTMIVRLPVSDQVQTAVVQDQRRSTRPLEVLVVDDEDAARDILSRYLLADGHVVVSAANSTDAIKYFLRRPFDLVITDQGMPGMNGVQLAKFLRETRPGQPIILASGFRFDANQLPPGVDKVLRKPVTAEMLRNAIAEVIHDGVLAQAGTRKVIAFPAA